MTVVDLYTIQIVRDDGGPVYAASITQRIVEDEREHTRCDFGAGKLWPVVFLRARGGSQKSQAHCDDELRHSRLAVNWRPYGATRIARGLELVYQPSNAGVSGYRARFKRRPARRLAPCS